MTAKRITPRQARAARAAAWRLALVEGRVVRLDASTCTSFPTVAEAILYAADALKAGMKAEILQVTLEAQAISVGLPADHWTK